MKEAAGKVFSIAAENLPVPGCTISKMVSAEKGYGVAYFSLAKGTDISAESYGYTKLWLIHAGNIDVFDPKGILGNVQKGQIFITPRDLPIGAKANTDTVYTEIALKEDTQMNQILKAGQVMTLKDLLPYQEGKIVNMDLVNDPHLKFVIMSFDEGTGLSEHAAPGEALVFALDGEAIIGYEGKEYHIQAGENFKFDKFGKHSVTAVGRFKMALLLMLDES